MKERTEKQKQDIIRLLTLLGMENDRAKILSIVTMGKTRTTSINAIWDYEAKVVIDALEDLLKNPDRQQVLINEIIAMAPVIAPHYGYITGDPVKNCFTLIGVRMKSMEQAHYFQICRAHNLLHQLYYDISEIAAIEVMELLDELNISTKN